MGKKLSSENKPRPKKLKDPRKATRTWLERLEKVESPDITFANHRFPIVMKRARGMVVTDIEKRKYTDFTACFGVVALGHGAQVVKAAIRKQSAQLIHGMGDVHPTQEKIRLLEMLSQLSPFQNAKVHLSLSGSEAVETALKTAMLVTKRSRFLSLSGGYHGLHMGAMTLSGMPFFVQGFEAWVAETTTVLPFPTEDEEANVLLKLESELKSKAYAAFVLEVVQGRGGDRCISPKFAKTAKSICEKYGTMLVFDEVFTGFGRTGKLFALEHVNVVPDIICLGKSLAGGLPLSACVAEAEIFNKWEKSSGEARHTSTFLGHPLACAVARATLSEIVRKLPDFQKELLAIEKTFQHFLDMLSKGGLSEKFPVRITGMGFMRGICFYEQPPGFAVQLMEELLDRGFLVLPSGEDARTVSLSPPLIAKATDYKRLFEELIKVLQNLRAKI